MVNSKNEQLDNKDSNQILESKSAENSVKKKLNSSQLHHNEEHGTEMISNLVNNFPDDDDNEDSNHPLMRFRFIKDFYKKEIIKSRSKRIHGK